MLTVADEGQGPPPDACERVVRAVLARRHGGGGSGLGLAIVRATAERHGGRASVGSTGFVIELPAFREALRVSGYTSRRGSRERTAVKLLRTVSTVRLIALATVFVVALAGAASPSRGSGGGGPTPPPKPLAQAIHDALGAPEPSGVTARISLHEQPLPVGRR